MRLLEGPTGSPHSEAAGQSETFQPLQRLIFKRQWRWNGASSSARREEKSFREYSGYFYDPPTWGLPVKDTHTQLGVRHLIQAVTANEERKEVGGWDEMELAETERETAAVADVFVAHILHLSSCLSTSFLPRWLSFFGRYCLFLSMFVTFSLPHTHTHSHTHKNRVITSPQGPITSVIRGSFMWCLGLKNQHLLLPPINHVSVCLWFDAPLGSPQKQQEMYKSLQMNALITCLCWKGFCKRAPSSEEPQMFPFSRETWIIVRNSTS